MFRSFSSCSPPLKDKPLLEVHCVHPAPAPVKHSLSYIYSMHSDTAQQPQKVTFCICSREIYSSELYAINNNLSMLSFAPQFSMVY